VESQQSLKIRILDYVFCFFKCRFKKRKKSHFLDFQKKRKKTYSRTTDGASYLNG